MIEDGFDDPEEYMRYLENLSFENFLDFDIEEEDIYSLEDETIEEINFKNSEEENETYEYYIFPRDKKWNKVVIKSIGTLTINKIFEKKYCRVNNYSLDFCTYNFCEYHEASLSLFRRDINFTERAYFERILLGDTNALQEANEYYKKLLFKHDSNNWKCSWDGIEIREINGKKCLIQAFSIYEGKYNALFKRNCYTFFFEQHQIEIYTKYDPVRGSMNDFDWKSIFEITVNSFKISKKLK